MVNLNVYTSLITSIIIQVVTGIIEFISLFVNLPSKFAFLKQMMLLEVFVQFIEGSFYVYWFNNFTNILNVTPTRYFDWVITTPTMLVNLIFYLIFLQKLDDNTSEQMNFFELFNQEINTIIPVLLLNWLMLLFGYLGEISVIPVLLGVLLGFIPFLIYYYMIYDKYALLSEDGYKIFMYFFIFWSLYGVVYKMNLKTKNYTLIFIEITTKKNILNS